MIPPREMIRVCRKFPKLMRLVDSTGKKLNGTETLLTTLVVRRLFSKILAPDEKNVGVLFPTSVYGAIVNAALAVDGRVSVNLNYTFSQETMNYCIKKAGIKHVLATSRLLERFPDLKLDAEVLILEDLVPKISVLDKLCGWIETNLLPTPILEWELGLTSIKPDDPIAIIFTSGSTGIPKGVQISHNNISANVAGFVDRIKIDENDRLLGILPMFHAFGFATNIWIALATSLSGIYHFNPLEPKKVGEMVRKYKANVMASTATFQRNYLRRCSKEDFQTMKTVVCGAEKVPLDLIEAWEKKFGSQLVEGYGTTELSPVVATNVDRTRRADYADWNRTGSVGRPLFNIQVRVVDLETGEVLAPNQSGMLQVKGPSVMLGYFDEPKKTAQVIKDGWYTTGDVAKIDEDGFIWITGRESRMSKIGGEMVPHILIEDMISRIINEAVNPNFTPESEDDGVQVAVTGLPDEKKGEKIVVLHKQIPITPEEICKKMHAFGIPNLWIPLATNFKQVEHIPLLGTGKLDLREVKEMAQKVFQD